MLNNIIERVLGTKQTTQINHDGYYYSCLSFQQKSIYNAIFQCLNTCSREVQITSLSVNEISDIYNSVLKDYPILFYTSAFKISSNIMSSTATFRPDYKYDHNTVQRYKDQILQYLKRFDLLKNISDLDKEMYVHNYCLDNFMYDNSFCDFSYSILGPILNKKAVCEGFARFTKLVLDYLSVKNLIVSGKAYNPAQNSSLEAHAWNIVMIDGKTFHLDTTWDICISDSDSSLRGVLRNEGTKSNTLYRYDYFNLSDEDILKDHVITQKVPICNTKGQDYYTKNGMMANNPAELEKKIEKVLKQGKKNITIKILNVSKPEKIIDKINQIALEQYIKTIKKSVQIEIRYNLHQMIFEIVFK